MIQSYIAVLNPLTSVFDVVVLHPTTESSVQCLVTHYSTPALAASLVRGNINVLGPTPEQTEYYDQTVSHISHIDDLLPAMVPVFLHDGTQWIATATPPNSPVEVLDVKQYEVA